MRGKRNGIATAAIYTCYWSKSGKTRRTTVGKAATQRRVDQCSLNRGYRITTWLWGRLVWRRRDGGRGRNMDCSQQTETSAATPSSPPAARHALFVTVLGLGGHVDRQSGRRKAEPSWSDRSMIQKTSQTSQSRPDGRTHHGLPTGPWLGCPPPLCLLCACASLPSTRQGLVGRLSRACFSSASPQAPQSAPHTPQAQTRI